MLLIPTLRELAEGAADWPLLLWGGVGAGKTCAALCMCDVSRWAYYYTVRQFVNERNLARNGDLVSHGTHETSLIRESDIVGRLGRASLVVLDEIAKREQPSAYEIDLVQELLDLRAGKPLILVSNRNISEIAAIYDDAVASRIAGGTVFAMDWPDRRLAH